MQPADTFDSRYWWEYYKITANELAPGSVYIDVGDEFGILDLSTGIVTPIFTVLSPHGADFVPFAEVPEPGSAELVVVGLLLFGALLTVKPRTVSTSV